MQLYASSYRASRTVKTLGLSLLGVLALGAMCRSANAQAVLGETLSGHIPYNAVAQARTVGRVSPDQPVPLALALPLRNRAELATLLHNLYDPRSPQFHHFLTAEQFRDHFSPTQEDYDRVIAYARAAGFTVVGQHSNRAVLDVRGSAATVTNAFGVGLVNYRAQSDGRLFYAPDREPTVPAEIADFLSNIIGLDTATQWKPHSQLRRDFQPGADTGLAFSSDVVAHTTGSGPSGGLTPSDIKTAYNLNSVSLTGSGQVLALFELDGYKASDITAYEAKFGLPTVTLQNVLVDGFAGTAGSGAGEVTLDIELQIALAPGVSKVMVYEGPNSNAGVVDTYNRIASDNIAKSVSTSWGLAENSSSASTRNSENTAFQQMAAQGQSIFAASGDSGAYDNGSSLSVDDPASQPYMTGVGGTKLTTSGAGGAYSTETTWNGGSIANGGGGGGISTVWTIPSYQSGVITTASKGSTTMRNVPDVSLDADPNNGYAIYYNGKWVVYGGTSCAAPLWSAFVALVNQQRVTNGSGTLGFANPSLYTAGKSSSYTTLFHDIADNSTNLFYPAVTGYDLATGWGTFNGANLLPILAGGTITPTVPAAPTGVTATAGNAQVALTWSASSGATSYSLYRGTTSGGESLYKTGLSGVNYTDTALTNGTTYYYQVTAVNSAGESGKSAEVNAKPTAGGTITQLLGNSGFENGSNSPAPWTVTSGVIDNSTGEAAHGGSWKAWMDGYGKAHTDSVLQTVAIPSTISTATLSFYLHIDTAETTKTTAYDTLKVQVRNSSGTVLATLATYSNLNAATGYTQKSFDLSAYKGQTVQIYLVGTEDSSLKTSFVVDDFALNVQ